MVKCSACAKFVGRSGVLVCLKCNGHYHCACVGVPPGAEALRNWSCPTCLSSLPRDNKADTPVKGLISSGEAIRTTPVVTATSISTREPIAATPAAAAAAPAVGTRPAFAAATTATQLAAPVAIATPDTRMVAGQSAAPVHTAVQTLLSSEVITDSPVPVADSGDLCTLGREIRLFREELQSVRQELKEFRLEYMEIRASINDFSSRMVALESRVDAVESRVASGAATAATRVLEEAIATLQLELNDRDQELLSNDVQISGVPEEPGESAAGLATRICVKLGVELDARDVVSVSRVGRAREAGRPRPLVLRLARRSVRDEVLRGARVRRGATTAELGLAAPPQRFYVNERLTATNRRLFQRAREAARAAAWRYVWTRDGKILARKADGLSSHRIRRESDLNIFKIGSV